MGQGLQALQSASRQRATWLACLRAWFATAELAPGGPHCACLDGGLEGGDDAVDCRPQPLWAQRMLITCCWRQQEASSCMHDERLHAAPSGAAQAGRQRIAGWGWALPPEQRGWRLTEAAEVNGPRGS